MIRQAKPDDTDAIVASAVSSGPSPPDGSMEGPPVGLGATRDELRRLLGAPTDTSVPTRSQRQPMIWRYGEVEYHFGPDGRVWMVYSEDANRNPRVLGRLTEG